VGFILIAVPVLTVTALAHLMFNAPVALGAPLAIVAVAANMAFQIWRHHHPYGPQAGGNK
jgi:hypothetical protein